MSTQILPETTYEMPIGGLVRIRQAVEDDLPGMEWDGEYAHFAGFTNSISKTAAAAIP